MISQLDPFRPLRPLQRSAAGLWLLSLGNCSNSTQPSWPPPLPSLCVFGVTRGGSKSMSILVSAAARICNRSLLLTSWSLRAICCPLLYVVKTTAASVAIRFCYLCRRKLRRRDDANQASIIFNNLSIMEEVYKVPEN